MDGDTLRVLLIFLLFIASFAGLIFWSTRLERKRQEAFQALADERGWRYENQRGSGRGKPSQLLFTSPQSDAPWQLRIGRRRSGGGGKTTRTSHPGSTEFRAPTPGLPGGLAVFMPEVGGGLTGAASAVMGAFDNKIGRKLLSYAVGPEVGEHVGSLQPFEAPAQSRLSVMATADPSLWFDMNVIGRAIHSWNPQRGANRAPPRVMIGTEGVTVTLNYEITDPQMIADFVALGQDIMQNAALQR